MASGRLIDYLGADVIANRPATPDLHANTLGLFYATDTDTLSAWDGSTWEDITGQQAVDIITEASPFTIVPATHAGRDRYIRAGGDVTFDSAEALAAGQVYTIRATGTIDLVEDGVTLTPPSGGTLELTVGMAVTVVMTSGTAGDVIGQTVPA